MCLRWVTVVTKLNFGGVWQYFWLIPLGASFCSVNKVICGGLRSTTLFQSRVPLLKVSWKLFFWTVCVLKVFCAHSTEQDCAGSTFIPYGLYWQGFRFGKMLCGHSWPPIGLKIVTADLDYIEPWCLLCPFIINGCNPFMCMSSYLEKVSLCAWWLIQRFWCHLARHRENLKKSTSLQLSDHFSIPCISNAWRHW